MSIYSIDAESEQVLRMTMVLVTFPERKVTPTESSSQNANLIDRTPSCRFIRHQCIKISSLLQIMKITQKQ